jgi:hypothetical protein
MAFFKYIRVMDCVRPLSAREADKECRHTDAGITYRDFVVQAESATAAADGARRWVACWADEDEESVPDDLMLEPREYRAGKSYMTLRVEP